MIRKSLFALAVATGAMAFASQAHAAVFNFGEIANNTTPGSYTGPSGEKSLGGVQVNSSPTFPIGSISITTSASNTTIVGGTPPPPYPYLDSSAGGLPAGLGVCQTDTTGCGGEDNVATGGPIGNQETLELDFGVARNVTGLTFRRLNHATNFDPTDDTILISVGGGGFSPFVLDNIFAGASDGAGGLV